MTVRFNRVYALQLIVFSVGFIYLLSIFGLIPLDTISSTGINFRVYGIIKSLSLDFGLKSIHNGYPAGVTLFVGAPHLLLSAVIEKFLGLGVVISSNLAIIIFLLVSYYSFFKLLVWASKDTILSLLAPLLFYSMPIIIGKDSYGSMMIGFFMMPYYIYSVTEFYNKANFITIANLLFMSLFAAFMDGYSFVFIAFFTGSYILFNLISSERKVYSSFFAFFAIAIAAFIYKSYLPETNLVFSPMPIDFFRGQGVDLLTLIYPDKGMYWLYNSFDFGAEYNPIHYYTDGEMVYHSFIGYSIIAIAIISLSIIALSKVFFIRKPIFFKAIIFVALVSFFISLGPSLKINDTNKSQETRITFGSYLMKPEQATYTFPYQDIYTEMPVLNVMRAVHRWLLMFKLGLVIIIVMALAEIKRYKDSKKRTLLVNFSLLLCILEFVPHLNHQLFLFDLNKGDELNSRDRNRNAIHFVDDNIVLKLKEYVLDNDIMAIYSHENDYMANYICANATIQCLNTGGDKAMAAASMLWPESYLNLKNELSVENIYVLLHESDVKYLMLPKFNMRWDSYGDKILNVQTESYNDKYNPVLDYETFNIVSEPYFYILSLK